MVSGNVPDYVVIHRMVGGLDSFPLLAVPFFILAGNLMNSAGITNRIYNFALALVGWMRGGLGHVNVLGSVIFAGMSGTAIASDAPALDFASAVNGSGTFHINEGATLEFGSSVASGAIVQFDGGTGELKLDAPESFNGVIAGFSGAAPASTAELISSSTSAGWEQTSDSVKARNPVVGASEVRRSSRQPRPKAAS